MASKTVCPKHEIAYEIGKQCLYCDDLAELEPTVPQAEHEEDECTAYEGSGFDGTGYYASWYGRDD